MPLARVEHRSGPAWFVAFPRMGWMPRMPVMPPMNSERLHFDGRHYDLAIFTRKVVSKKEKGLFFEKQKRPCEAMLHPDTLIFKGVDFLRNRTPRQGPQ